MINIKISKSLGIEVRNVFGETFKKYLLVAQTDRVTLMSCQHGYTKIVGQD